MKAQSRLVLSESFRSSVVVRLPAEDEVQWFDGLLADHHYLGAGRSVGDYLRQVVEINGKAVALLVWGPACYALKDRDLWISWSVTQRLERLKLIVQNRRFLVLNPKGESPNLASQAMGAALRVLPEQWRQRFGYRPLLAESFTDPEAYAGTCYKASNWEAVGYSAGYSRHRADFYIPNERPKRLWLRPLVPQARQLLRGVALPADCQAGLTAAPSGTLPVNAEQLGSLWDVFRKAPDPRDANTRYRIGPVLTLIAMALLAGRREIAEIAHFATTLTQPQRRRLALPRKKSTRAFYEVPGYSVFYQVLTRMDPEAFATLLNGWLQSRLGTLPLALALDGKMIRDHIGLLTLAQHEDGAPQAVALYDQKEGTARCEQTAAATLLETLPAWDGKIITADPLHCQRHHARTIVEKGGDYLLQIKGNQPNLLKQAQGLDALKDTPFLPTPIPDTDASRPGVCMPSPSNHSPRTFPMPEP
ncbi:MAG: ISAs1 family transposase [Acidobacteriales bacterium]|nr:ISAs1 family transposase [Terriglobales bacterium]